MQGRPSVLGMIVADTGGIAGGAGACDAAHTGRAMRGLLLWLACLLPGWLPAFSAVPVRIEGVGPFGGTVRSLLVSRHQPDLAYLGTSDGRILRSSDGGRSWRALYPGIGQRHLVLDTLVEHPGQAGHLYAGAWDRTSQGGGLFESRDGGQHWDRVALPNPASAVRGLALSSARPERMIVGTLTGAYVTQNGGVTWQEVRTPDGPFVNVESVAVGPQDGNRLFIGTWRLGYRSTDFGRSWTQNSKGMMLDSDVFSIATDDSNARILYAGACTGVYRSTDAGASWVRLRVLSDTFVIRTHVVSIDPTHVHRIYAGTTVGLHVSENDGRSWRPLTPTHIAVNAIQIDPRDGKRILLGTDKQGVLRSTDGGRSWESSNIGFAARGISRIVPMGGGEGSPLSGLLSDGATGGFYVFDEGEAQWLPQAKRTESGLQILSFLVLPGGNGRLYGTPQGIYLEKPSVAQWTRLAGPVAQLAINDIVLDRENRWIFAGTNKGIYRARLDDLRFSRPAGYRLIPRVSSLVVSPNSPKIVFAATHMGLLRSSDHGATWDIISAGLPADTIVECLTVDPADVNHLFAGTGTGLYESRDRGALWAEVPLGSPKTHIPSIIFLNPAGSLVVAANRTQGSVYLSEDGGRSWSRLDAPELQSPVQCMVADPTRRGSVFLGTQSEGILRLAFPVDPAQLLFR